MNSYFIKEFNTEMTYIELRIFSYVECALKAEKILELLQFLSTRYFLVNLTNFRGEDMLNDLITPENHYEREDVMSITIDTKNDKLRFKFWNGASTQWFYHTEDLFNALDTGREKFSELYDKYELVTDVLLDFKRRWSTSIFHISYNYSESDEFDIIYHIVFYEEVKKANYTARLLDKINNEIIMLGEDVTNDLNFKIEHSFKDTGCKPCEKARKEREKNERQNTNDKKKDV